MHGLFFLTTLSGVTITFMRYLLNSLVFRQMLYKFNSQPMRVCIPMLLMLKYACTSVDLK